MSDKDVIPTKLLWVDLEMTLLRFAPSINLITDCWKAETSKGRRD